MSTPNSISRAGLQSEQIIELSSVTNHELVAREGNMEGLLSVLCRLVWMIGLASLVVVGVSGQFPWFLVSLAVVLSASACMALRQNRQRFL